MNNKKKLHLKYVSSKLSRKLAGVVCKFQINGNWSVFAPKHRSQLKLVELRKTPEDNHHSLPPNVIKRFRRHCYMDDCLKSLPAEQKAVEHVGSLSTLLSRGGF